MISNKQSTVKVVVRIRPPKFNSSIGIDNNSIHIEHPHPLTYNFDKVCDFTTNQLQMYNLVVEPLIKQFLMGYNGTLLAYGQTSSGKTYTMGTGSSSIFESGMIIRASERIFNLIQSKSIKLYASYLEIYNETLHDLLYGHDNHVGWNLGDKPKLLLRQDTQGRIHCLNATRVLVTSKDQIYNLLQIGSLRRRTGSTLMNEDSSRSHAIFTLNLCDNDINSKLHFVDLAGSERIKKTGASGGRAKEGIAINGGLLALSNVISALAEGNSGHHVPFRESKLTRLLQGSIGNNAYTTMIACISPDKQDINETLNTLKYASRARKIQVDATISKEPETIDSLKATILLLQEEIQQLKSSSSNNLLKSWIQKSQRLESDNLKSKQRYSKLQHDFIKFKSNKPIMKDTSTQTEEQLNNISFNTKLSAHSIIDDQYQHHIMKLKSHVFKSDHLALDSLHELKSPTPINQTFENLTTIPTLSRAINEINQLNYLADHINNVSSYYTESTPGNSLHLDKIISLHSLASLPPSPKPQKTKHRQAIYGLGSPVLATATALAHQSPPTKSIPNIMNPVNQPRRNLYQTNRPPSSLISTLSGPLSQLLGPPPY